MTTQIKPSVTNPSIANLYQEIEQQRLILRPAFQRKFVWTHNHQEQFIDTIIRGFPFPEIYVCQGEIDLNLLRTTQYVIDGQQRLTTIKRYIDGEHDREPAKIPTFANLSSAAQKAFLHYQVVVRDIGQVDEDVIREVFRRINLTKFQLDNIEVHNAIYDGSFITSAKEILEQNPLAQYGVFHESEFTRMADLHFILLVMSTIENDGYFPQDNEMEQYIAQFNDEYPNQDEMQAKLLRTFEHLDQIRLRRDSIWFRKSNFFTIVVEIARNIDRMPDAAEAGRRLADLEDCIMKNKDDAGSPFQEYYSYMYQNTNGRKARVVRAEMLKKHLFRDAP